jgi:hypothetical protein
MCTCSTAVPTTNVMNILTRVDRFKLTSAYKNGWALVLWGSNVHPWYFFMDCAVRAWYDTLIADLHRSTYYIRTAWDNIEKIDCKLYCEKRDQTRSSLSCIEESRMNALHEPMATYVSPLTTPNDIISWNSCIKIELSKISLKTSNWDKRT